MMILFELYKAFFFIGAIAFGGGYASLPMIQDTIVHSTGWLTMTEMIDVVTISQLTPGPIAVNAASFVGTKMASIPGAIFATLGVVTPQTILMLILGKIVFSGKEIKILDKMLGALRPGVVGLIANATLSMMVSSMIPETVVKPDMIGVIGFIIGLILSIKKIDLFKIIFIGAAIGIILAAMGFF
ncbi:MAG: chromate transporter [Peptoniphilaceae bacterium]|nr:chromate transporter [Peptoniphilaceae bacterium]MDD7382805.1 chromate transporter [Peptoniphilaceae bacterium]MDY3737963.1 chromate transporter [Peptoniphilaceae bacterium]